MILTVSGALELMYNAPYKCNYYYYYYSVCGQAL